MHDDKPEYSLDISHVRFEPVGTGSCAAPTQTPASLEYQIFLPNQGRLHSRHPKEEALRQINLLELGRGPRKKLVIGIGWGYMIDAIIQTATSKDLAGHFLYFYEPIVQLRDFLIKQGRIQQWQRKNANIHVIENLALWLEKNSLTYKDSTLGAQNNEQTTKIEIVVHPNYRRLFPNWCISTLRHLGKALSIKKDKSTEKAKNRFGRLWFYQTLRSLSSNTRLQFVASSPNDFFQKKKSQQTTGTINKANVDASGTAKASAGTNFLFCGGGPLLLDELETVRKEAPSLLAQTVVIASDTAIVPLLHAGFHIDLILSVDSGRGTLMHFAPLQQFLAYKHTKQQISKAVPTRSKLQIPVLTWMGGNVHLPQWFETVQHYLTTYPLDQILQQSATPHLPIWENPSSSLTGLSILIAACGKRPASIFTAGVSYRHSQRQSHVRGSGYTYYAQCQCHRTHSMTTQQIGKLHYPTRISSADKENWRTIQRMARQYNVRLHRLSPNVRSPSHRSLLRSWSHQAHPKQNSSPTKKKQPLLKTKNHSGKELYTALCSALREIPLQTMQKNLAIDFDYTEKLHHP